MNRVARFCDWLFSGTRYSRTALVTFLTVMMLFGSCFPGCEKFKPTHGQKHVAGKPFPIDVILPADVDQPSELAVESVIGVWKFLVVCVDFVDNPATVDPVDYDTLLFQPNTVSVRDYYDENSRGLFTIVSVNLPSQLGWNRAPNPYSYYTDSSYGMGGAFPRNSRGLTRDIAFLIDPVVDFSKYDNDGNGIIDALTIIHAGIGAESGGGPTTIWSHKGSVAGYNINLDGMKLDAFVMCPEFEQAPGDATIGVFAHEWGHVLGLPDLYDIDGSSRGVGHWSMMASGSWNGPTWSGESPAHFDPWCKAKLGWVTPVNVMTNVTNLRLPPFEETGTVLRLWSDGVKGREYFLVANHQQMGYDVHLPWEGLLIWHIDEWEGRNSNEWWPNNPDTGNYLVAVEQADGRWDLEHRRNYGDAWDPYPYNIGPGNDKNYFTPASVPSSLPYSGSPSTVAVTNIRRDGNDILLDVSVTVMSGVFDDPGVNDSMVGLQVEYFPNPFSEVLHLTIQPYDQSVTEVKIYDILGREVIGFKMRGQESYEFWWSGVNENGYPVASGVYILMVKNCGKRFVTKVVLIK